MAKYPEPLTAAEFFDRAGAKFTKTAAMRMTGLSYSAVHDTTIGMKMPRRSTLQLLQDWSLAAVPEFNCYISAIKTIGLAEPTAEEIAKAAKAGSK